MKISKLKRKLTEVDELKISFKTHKDKEGLRVHLEIDGMPIHFTYQNSDEIESIFQTLDVFINKSKYLR